MIVIIIPITMVMMAENNYNNIYNNSNGKDSHTNNNKSRNDYSNGNNYDNNGYSKDVNNKTRKQSQ